MKIIYNMDELAKKLGTGKITSIVITDLCLCVECSEKQEKYLPTQKQTKTISKKSLPPKTKQPDKLSNFEKMMRGPSF
jgi:hypothetical protein